jgi:shikimate dehydrogenase
MTMRAGVIGHPLGHSISPAIFAAAFAAAGVDATYELWDTEPDVLAARIEALRGDGFLGASITIPYKQAVVPMLDGSEAAATTSGAVNTIAHQAGKLIGHNTDVAGFARSLKEDAGFEARGKRCVLLGSGGAAHAVGLALVEAGASVIYVVGRQPRRVEAVVLALKPLTSPGTTISWAYWGDGSFLRALAEADLVVNCTPVGTAGSPATEGQLPIEATLIAAGSTVFDLVYNPSPTPLVRAAQARSAKAVGGLGMLVYQAAEQFKIWTGKEADVAAMLEAAKEALGAG